MCAGQRTSTVPLRSSGGGPRHSVSMRLHFTRRKPRNSSKLCSQVCIIICGRASLCKSGQTQVCRSSQTVHMTGPQIKRHRQ